MSAADTLVMLGGIAGIAWVNWYFFLSGRTAASARTGAAGVQEVTITVEGGYDPARVIVVAGAPVRLVFDRREKSGCSEEVVIPEFGIRKFLPAFQKTAIELRAAEAGSYEFTCGMGMLRGQLIVREGQE